MGVTGRSAEPAPARVAQQQSSAPILAPKRRFYRVAVCAVGARPHGRRAAAGRGAVRRRALPLRPPRRLIRLVPAVQQIGFSAKAGATVLARVPCWHSRQHALTRTSPDGLRLRPFVGPGHGFVTSIRKIAGRSLSQEDRPSRGGIVHHGSQRMTQIPETGTGISGR